MQGRRVPSWSGNCIPHAATESSPASAEDPTCRNRDQRCLVLQLSVGAGKLINERKTNCWDCFHLNVLQKVRGGTAVLFVSWSQEILLAEWRNEKRRQRREWRKNMSSFSTRWPCGQPELNPSREQRSHLATRTMFIHQLPQSEIKCHSKRSLDSLARLTHCTGGQNRVLQP